MDVTIYILENKLRDKIVLLMHFLLKKLVFFIFIIKRKNYSHHKLLSFIKVEVLKGLFLF